MYPCACEETNCIGKVNAIILGFQSLGDLSFNFLSRTISYIELLSSLVLEFGDNIVRGGIFSSNSDNFVLCLFRFLQHGSGESTDIIEMSKRKEFISSSDNTSLAVFIINAGERIGEIESEE